MRRSCPDDSRAKWTAGFSLVEIAIVLAVIGALAAAIIVKAGAVFGRANTASLIANVKDLAAASRDFKARYSYFPGDLPNAEKYLNDLSDSCKTSGNGNGLVDTPTESDCALEHLVKAGMVGKAEWDGTRYVIVNSGVRVSLWFDSTGNANAVRVSNVPCDIALEIDRKLDNAPEDNNPFSKGSVTADGIQTCVPGSTNDPVATLLIRY